MKEATQVEVEIDQLQVAGAEMEVVARVRVKTIMPEQNEKLPHVLERETVQAGQAFMREFYRQVIEKADLELVLSNRAGKEGKGIQRIGKRSYTFKTRFGTIRVKRIRVKYKADGMTEVVSHRIWGTPKQICIVEGLKEAVCNLVVKQTFNSTVRQLEAETGEEKVLSKSSIGNILHEAGGRLAEAQSERAKQVYEQDERVKSLLGRGEAYIADDFFEDVWLDGEEIDEEKINDLLEEIEWDPREYMEGTNNSNAGAKTDTVDGLVDGLVDGPVEQMSEEITGLDPEVVVIEPDEVVVRSQAIDASDATWLLNYAAVVIAAGKTYYLTAISTTQLFYQVASLLGVLGVHREGKRLLLISDGAAWIRRWFETLGIAEKESILCWYHLKKRCWRLIREAIKNKEDRIAVKKELLRYLWRGQVEEASKYLSKIMTDIEDGILTIEINDIKKIEALRDYLLLRQPHIPDYLARVKARQWIASTKVEKFNDWSVSVRCKKQNGMRWTSEGVGAIAALEAARRNGELEEWRESGKLPSWEEVIKKVA